MLAAIAITLKLKLTTPAAPDALDPAIFATPCRSSKAIWPCPEPTIRPPRRFPLPWFVEELDLLLCRDRPDKSRCRDPARPRS